MPFAPASAALAAVLFLVDVSPREVSLSVAISVAVFYIERTIASCAPCSQS
jgi:hypothetical protein